MAKFEVEFASFRKMQFEADNQEEADIIASAIEDEEIEQKSTTDGYVIWNEPREVNYNLGG